MRKNLLKRYAVMLGTAAVCTALACFVPIRHIRLPENEHFMVDILVHRSSEVDHTTLYGQDQAALLELIRQADLRVTPPGMDAQTFSLDDGPYIVVMLHPRDTEGTSHMLRFGTPIQGEPMARLKPQNGMQYTILDPAPIITAVTELAEENGLSV